MEKVGRWKGWERAGGSEAESEGVCVGDEGDGTTVEVSWGRGWYRCARVGEREIAASDLLGRVDMVGKAGAQEWKCQAWSGGQRSEGGGRVCKCERVIG